MEMTSLAERWTRVMAPRTGDIRTELLAEAAEFLGIPIDEAWRRHAGAADRFNQEWTASVGDVADDQALTRFYNESKSVLFELIEWHASDAIHYRTLIVADLAGRRPGRLYLDYGSGIGSDAMVFAEAGFKVTLADISDPLLAFASWRLRRRGFDVDTIDLKREKPPRNRYDVAVCFDVLEHIPHPLRVVRTIRDSMRNEGLLVVHAPFGVDPERPMHVVHRDVVTPRMRSLGFRPVECYFPPQLWGPEIYRKATVPAIERLAYFVYDNYLNNPLGAGLAAFYREAARRRRRPESA